MPLLSDAINQIVSQGQIVNAHELQTWLGGDIERIEDHLKKLCKQGVIKHARAWLLPAGSYKDFDCYILCDDSEAQSK